MTKSLRNGRYTIKKILKTDSFSTVSLAWDTLLLHDVIIRECRRGMSAKEDFIKEGGILFCQYDWSGLAAVTDLFSEKERAYLVTEYLSGLTLREYLKRIPEHRISPEKAAELLAPVMETLAFLHKTGLLHGNITPDHLRFDENNHLKLTGAGKFLYRMKHGVHRCPGRNGALPPESAAGIRQSVFVRRYRNLIPERILNSEGGLYFRQGPWTDVYGICQVFYTAITGTGRKSADYAFSETGQKVNEILLKGMSPSVRERCFCMETLMERLSMDTSAVHPAAAETQNKWGELWLFLTTLPDEDAVFAGHRILTRRQVRLLFRLAAVFVLVLGAGALSLHLYADTHPKEVLDFRLKKDQEKLSAQKPEAVNKYSDTFDSLKKIAAETGKATEYDNLTDYHISAKTVEKYKLYSNEYQTFKVREDTLAEAVGYWLSWELPAASSQTRSADILCYNGALEQIKVSSYELDTYELDDDGNTAGEESGEENKANTGGSVLKIRYDQLSRAAVQLDFTSSEQNCSVIMKNILPLLVPEAYLTDGEIESLFAEASSDSGSASVYHGKYQLTLYHHGTSEEPDNWKLSISSYLLADSPEGTYAGSLSRSSERYGEYLKFLSENAVSVEKVDDKETYTLDEEAVREWGEPSNCWLLDFTWQEFLDELKEKGYEPKAGDSGKNYTAEVSSYGIIKTNFFNRDTYLLDDQEIELIYDVISQKLWSVVVCDLQNREELLSKTAADIAQILSEDAGNDTAALKEEYLSALKTFITKREEGNTHYYSGANYADCSFLMEEGLKDQYYYFYFVRYGMPDSILSDSYPPYNG